MTQNHSGNRLQKEKEKKTSGGILDSKQLGSVVCSTNEKKCHLNRWMSKDLAAVCDSKALRLVEDLIGDWTAVADPVKACK